jgi:hypothetical protein
MIEANPAPVRRQNQVRWLRRYFPSIAACSVVVIHFLIALNLSPNEHDEVFPFFKWNLFSSLHKSVVEFEVHVAEFDGQIISEKKSYYDLANLFPAAKRYESYVVIQALGRAFKTDNSEKLKQMRRIFESYYLGGHTACYVLSLVEYDPLEKRRSSVVQSRIEISRFCTGEN